MEKSSGFAKRTLKASLLQADLERTEYRRYEAKFSRSENFPTDVRYEAKFSRSENFPTGVRREESVAPNGISILPLQGKMMSDA